MRFHRVVASHSMTRPHRSHRPDSAQSRTRAKVSGYRRLAAHEAYTTPHAAHCDTNRTTELNVTMTARENHAPNADPLKVSRLALPVFLLGITQIIAWGSLFYSIAVLAQPIADDLGISTTMVFGAFSLSLAVSGLTAPAIGRAIDSLGGYRVLAGGSVISAIALALIAIADGPLLLFVGWALAGVAMAANLYDAAFPALSQFAGTRYRQALTALTLLGGLASTAFWPLAWVLNDAHGWRVALGLFALMHLLVCLPIHYWGLPRPRLPESGGDAPPNKPVAVAGGKRFWWLAAGFTISAFVVSGTAAHAVGVLKASGLDPATAIFAVALIGPMQVVGRLLEFVFARGVAATLVGLASFSIMLCAMVLLSQVGFAPWVAFAFACAYGLSNGVMSIVRGTVPAELFGRDGYGALMGRLAQPAFFAKAAAPVALAALVANGETYQTMVFLLAALAALALAAYIVAIRGFRPAVAPDLSATPESDGR